MSCHVEEVVFAGVKTQVIWCGDDPPAPLPCQACGAKDAPWLCDWPVMKTVDVAIEEAQVGDVWITENLGKIGRIVKIDVLYFEASPSPSPLPMAWRVWVQLPKRKDAYPYHLFRGRSFQTQRPGTCDAPCCDAHAREVGDEVHYCQDHWGAWEGVA